jgi:hypothetical protein
MREPGLDDALRVGDAVGFRGGTTPAEPAELGVELARQRVRSYLVGVSRREARTL